jgi:hypothetical protein
MTMSGITATTAFVIMAYPPVTVTDLLVPAHSGSRQPQNTTYKNTEHGTMCEKLWQIKLRQLV